MKGPAPTPPPVIISLSAGGIIVAITLTLVAAAWGPPGPVSRPPAERLLHGLPLALVAGAIGAVLIGSIARRSLRGFEGVVTALRRELQRSDQKYRTLVGRASEGIFLWDPETLRIVEANARAGKLLGRRPRELVGESFDRFVAQPDRARAADVLRGVSRSGTVGLDEVQIVPDEGAPFPAEVAASIVRFEEGEVVLGIARDRTSVRDLERKATLLGEQLIEAEKMTSIGLLAAGVAHEVNNPMGYVASNVNRLVEYVKRLQDLVQHHSPVDSGQGEIGDLSSELEEIAQETLEGVQRVTEIVRALREFAHGGSGESAYEWVDLNRVIRNCLTLVHNQIKNRAEVELDLEPLPSVSCHPTQIGQVLINLLVNAAQAVEPPGRIRVASYNSGDHVHVAVEDNGAGIEPQHLRRIFEPFFTTKSTGTGTGLGLAVSREILRRHEGDLSVDSVLGRGTRFLMELPRRGPLTDGK